VSIELDRALEIRRDRTAAAWDLDDEIVLLGAGEAITIPGHGDQTYPYWPHTEYFYLTDRDRPGSVLAFDPGEGWIDFVPEVTREERVWTGGVEVDGRLRRELAGWLAERSGRPVAVLGCPVDLPSDKASPDEQLTERLRLALSAVRRPKDAVELDRMREAARCSRAGYAAIRDVIRPGVTEREVGIEIEHAFRRAGADAPAYRPSSDSARTRRCSTSCRANGGWRTGRSC